MINNVLKSKLVRVSLSRFYLYIPYTRTCENIYIYSGVRTNINELYLDIWLFNNSHLCQFIEIIHKIINWYMKNAK